MKTTSLKVTFNGKVLINDKMDEATLNAELQEGFKSLATAINAVTRIEGRKGLTHTLEIDGEKCTFKGGGFGQSIIKALVAHHLQTSGNFRLQTAKDFAKEKIATIPVSARAVQAVKVFDGYLEGKVLATDVSKAIAFNETKAKAIKKAEVVL